MSSSLCSLVSRTLEAASRSYGLHGARSGLCMTYSCTCAHGMWLRRCMPICYAGHHGPPQCLLIPGIVLQTCNRTDWKVQCEMCLAMRRLLGRQCGTFSDLAASNLWLM